MTHAERYVSLHNQMNNKLLDSSYQAALYILSCDEKIMHMAFQFVSPTGIDFSKILIKVSCDDHLRKLVAIVHNLFRWETNNPISPHEISTLSCPYISYALQAIFIASGLHRVEIQNDDAELKLSIDDSKYTQAENINKILGV